MMTTMKKKCLLLLLTVISQHYQALADPAAVLNVDPCLGLAVRECRFTDGCLWTSADACAAFSNRCLGLSNRDCLNTGGCKILSDSSSTCVLDPNPPTCKVLEHVIEFQGQTSDEESGIWAVVLLEGSENLVLNVDLFTPGDTTVALTAVRADNNLPAKGMIQVFDQAGLTCDFSVALEPFDFQLFNEQIAFPGNVDTQLFSRNSPSPNQNPIYYTSTVLPERLDFDNDILQDMTVSEDFKAIEESVNSFAFRGFFRRDEISVEVVALAYTYNGIEPPGGSNVVVIYDPTVFFGVTDDSDSIEIEPFDFPDPLPLDVRRKLEQQGPNMGSNPFQLSNSGLRVLQQSDGHTENVFDMTELQESVLVPRGGARLLQAESCGNALQEAIEAASCEPPQEVSVRNACVASARFAYNQAIAFARGEYDTAIEIAKKAHQARTILINANKIVQYRRFLFICLLVGTLTGPLGGAICAARAVAQTEGISLAAKLASQAALELARENALATLRLALAAACQTLRLAIFACITCVTCPDPNQQPCGDSCYDPNSQKCCPDTAIVSRDNCCPGEKKCPEGCIPEDSCCPDQKKCNGACIPRRDCCDPPSSRRLGEPFPEPLFMKQQQRNLQADPCCTDPDDPCCGSDDPCCGSEDPCCGSNDPCCVRPALLAF
eukprot:scaffold2257_cov169-Amphora_coffeaeformis.AAC.2